MNTRVTLVHLACFVLGVACIVLAFTLLKGEPEAQVTLVSAAVFVWGWLGFKPAKPVVDKIVLSLPPEEVARIQSMKPAAPQPPQPTAAEPSDSPIPPPPPPALG